MLSEFSAENPLHDNVASLEMPFSIDQHGNFVTMRDYVAVYGHQSIRDAIGNPTVDPARKIKTGDELTQDDLFKLAEDCMAAEPDNVAESYGGRTYTKQDRVKSIQQRDGHAHEFVESLHCHMKMVETAIQTGHIKFVDSDERIDIDSLLDW
jgi:hypothetical protein